MYQYFFFDLDGTLTNPKEGITKSVRYALKHFGIEEPNLDNLVRFIGPPLQDSFCEYYGFSPEKSMEAVLKMRERYQTVGKFENEIFEGIPELLSDLKAQEKVLAVSTSKPESFATDILKHFHILEYFDVVVGANLDGTRTRKWEVIEETLKRLGIGENDYEKVLMVGDRKHDVEGAAHFGIDCAGVYYGFAESKELEEAGAVITVNTVEELRKYLEVHL